MTAPDMPGRAPLPPLPPKWTGKYRKRPVVVEAVQLVDDDACDWDEIARWCGGRIYNIETSPGAEPQTLIDIRTLEGIMTAGEGWWVVRGIVGEFHPVRADIFEATYEPAAARLSAAAPGPRDPQAGQDHAEWLGWAEANGNDHDCDPCRELFIAGMQAQRALDDATLAAEVRAGHVRIETGGVTPEQAPQISVNVTGVIVQVVPRPGWTIGAIATHARWQAGCGSIAFDNWEYRTQDGRLLDPSALPGALEHLTVVRLTGIGA